MLNTRDDAKQNLKQNNFHAFEKFDLPQNQKLQVPAQLRHLIRESVALLGEVIKRELGQEGFEQIENIRVEMTELRESSYARSFSRLTSLKHDLEKLKPSQRYQIAHAFTLMLELMNVAESAYRSYRLTVNKKTKTSDIHPESITYVLTAHPTEARTPQNIMIFHEIQKILLEILTAGELEKNIHMTSDQKADLLNYLELAWKTPVMRNRSPKVKDEAEALYSHLFREGILKSLMNANERKVKLRLHSWIGGDKDGHPGVDESTLLESLTLSRGEVLKLISDHLIEVRNTLSLTNSKSLTGEINQLLAQIKNLRVIKAKDAVRIEKIKHSLFDFFISYETEIGATHPNIRTLGQLLELFPGLVIPMELREASDVLMSRPHTKKGLAIERMLSTIAQISQGGDARWYARSFIISMTQSAEHLKMAAAKQKKFLNHIILPIVPLFEEATSLAKSSEIMNEALSDETLKEAITSLWDSKVEIMVGYSDSSKEAGVFPSRLAIAEALPKLEKVCREHKVTPIFFHGSGGSIDRGGGTIENQTAWWPKSAVNNYKGTIQGEMIERWLATPMIAQRQLENISQCASVVLQKTFHSAENENLQAFADKVSQAYRAKITDPDFLEVVKQATPYAMMSYLKLGSRPARRTKEINVKGLRAIPWILCWTQTRLLFPIWWGVGHAWEKSSLVQKTALVETFKQNAVFNSYIKALDFTLAKVELAVFKTYLQESPLPQELVQKTILELETEYIKAVKFCKIIMGSKKLLDSQQWLQESVHLRAPMIHPLNLLQTIAMKNKEIDLLRLTVTGISSGMMATG